MTEIDLTAEDHLPDRRIFRIDDESWSDVTALLDRPGERVPELAALLGCPAPWDSPG